MADDALVTQLVIEVARRNVSEARTTQLIAEISRRNPNNEVRSTQLVVEVASQVLIVANEVKSTQEVVEYVHKHVSESRVTQVVVEYARLLKPKNGGLFLLTPSNTHDNYYPDIIKKIPNPTIRTGGIGE